MVEVESRILPFSNLELTLSQLPSNQHELFTKVHLAMAPSLSSPVFLASFAVPSSSKSSSASSKGKHVRVASVQPLKGKGKKLPEEVAVGVDGEGIWRYDVSNICLDLEGIKFKGVWERGRARKKVGKENLLRSTSSPLGALPASLNLLRLSCCSQSCSEYTSTQGWY